MAPSLQHLDRLRLRHLRLLDLIEQHGSLRAVAGVFNLTQPAISQMVKDLERAFGVILVERSARGVSLTAAGKYALQRARSGLAAFDHLADELQMADVPQVRIGTNPAMLFQLLPTAINLLKARDARMRFNVRTGMVNDMLLDLWAGNLDCYVGRIDWDRLPPTMLDVLSQETLNTADLILCCSADHPLAGRSDLAVSDLLDFPWALPPEDSNNRLVFETAFRNLGFVGPIPAVEVASDPNALIHLARQSGFLTCVPRVALDAHLDKHALRAIEIPGFHLPPIQIGFVTLEQNESLHGVAFLRQALKEAAASTAGE